MKKITDFPVIRVLLLDLLLLNLINAFFVLEVKGYDYGITSTGEHYLFLLVLLNLLWVVINVLVTRYKMDIHRGIVEEVRKILFNMVLFTGTVSVIAFVFKEFRFSRIIVYGTLAAFFVGQLIFHLTLLGTIKT
ncbi:MAG: hypothetical protein GY940_03035, partial [bacterium]|nr:hypothetical protein [bacterium]